MRREAESVPGHKTTKFSPTLIFKTSISPMLTQKENFLRNECVILLQKLDGHEKGKWGKMDGQQMVEHLRDVCKLANGRIVLPLLNTDPEKLERARVFMMSDTPFQENTKVAVMPDEPRPHKYSNLQEAISKMETELHHVFTVYAADADKTLMHPMFGALNYEQQIHYLDKHVRHHLRQFGLVE